MGRLQFRKLDRPQGGDEVLACDLGIAFVSTRRDLVAHIFKPAFQELADGHPARFGVATIAQFGDQAGAFGLGLAFAGGV